MRRHCRRARKAKFALKPSRIRHQEHLRSIASSRTVHEPPLRLNRNHARRESAHGAMGFAAERLTACGIVPGCARAGLSKLSPPHRTFCSRQPVTKPRSPPTCSKPARRKPQWVGGTSFVAGVHVALASPPSTRVAASVDELGLQRSFEQDASCPHGMTVGYGRSPLLPSLRLHLAPVGLHCSVYHSSLPCRHALSATARLPRLLTVNSQHRQRRHTGLDSGKFRLIFGFILPDIEHQRIVVALCRQEHGPWP